MRSRCPAFRFPRSERIIGPVTELFDHIDQLRHSARRVAVATLVSTRGTTPRKEGAKMLVDEHGSVLGSVTIGGCVDAQVIQESAEVLGTMRPRLLELDLGDEEAWEIGLTCGGTIEVFVEPVALDRSGDPAARLLERLREHAASGGRGALVTLLAGPTGEAGDGAGAKLLVLDDGRTEGTIGAPAVDAELAAEARTAMAESASRVWTRGDVRAFIDVIAPPALLLVIGGGHVAMPLTSLARVLGYRTVVVDARARFATRERFPDVDELRVGIPSELVREYPLVPSSALVLVAHDYKYDLPVLRHALGTGVGYVGMLGSSRRGATILKLLGEEGVPDGALGRVHVPIGLDLGARSAPEIALAILAEIQAARTGGTGRPLRDVKRARPPSATEDTAGTARPEVAW
jgi:xanthine dehydrogenase accessory factor